MWIVCIDFCYLREFWYAKLSPCAKQNDIVYLVYMFGDDFTRLYLRLFVHNEVICVGNCRELHPGLQSNLAEFRQHLVDSLADMAPLKVWQLQGDGSLVILS